MEPENLASMQTNGSGIYRLMNLSFQINFSSIDDFISHWSEKYKYPLEEKYDNNIGKPLDKVSRLELFEWKNGSVISSKKLESIKNNYPIVFDGNLEDRYLNHKKSGGAIWNIFYMHCLNPDSWPIFDQHTFRAMKYMQMSEIMEIGKTNKQKYQSYKQEYLPFFNTLGSYSNRKIDKALFAFGKFLKVAKKYV